MHAAHIYSLEEKDVIDKTLSTLQSYNMEFSENKSRKKLKFIIRQLELLADKKFTTADYCFAVESFPRCSYEQLREVLVLPCKRKMQSVISGVDLDKELAKILQKINNIQHKKRSFDHWWSKDSSFCCIFGWDYEWSGKEWSWLQSIINAVRDAEMLAWRAKCDDLNYTCTQTDCRLPI